MAENFDVLKLSNQLCFPLYAASKEVVRKYRPYLDEIGLTYTQYVTMMVLWEEKTCNVKELGAKLYLDSGTLTPLLKQLEGKGFIKREHDKKDERVLNLSLTESGENLKHKAVDIPLKVAGCVNLSSEEAVLLHKLLSKILKCN